MKKPEPEKPILITRREAARLMSVTERHLQNLEAKGLFKPVRLGTSVRYQRSEVEAVIRRLAEGGSETPA